MEEDIHLNSLLQSPTSNGKTNTVVYVIAQTGNIGKTYTGLKGRFPYRLSRGNNYVLFACQFDVNTILALPININSTTSWNINYANTYFERQSLPKNHANPDYHSLNTIRDQIRCNLASISAKLEGGASSHISLYYATVEYVQVNVIPYVRSAYPGVLVIPLRKTQLETTHLTEIHKAEVKLFREVTDIEKIVIK